MHFQPIDEYSLRHLFSSCYAQDKLKVSYLGPVLNASNTIETSPDCLVVDKGKDPWEIRRCEFKYEPKRKEDFENNGKFNIAIVWRIKPPLNKETLRRELLAQNDCSEVIVLSDYKAFSDLPEHDIPDADELNKMDQLSRVIIGCESYPTVVAAWIAARIYPEEFRIDTMVNVLTNRFAEVKRMKDRGKHNVVSKLLQTKPPLIKFMYGKTYRWNDNMNPNMAVKEMEQLIRTRFHKDIPSSEILDSFRI